MMKKLGIYLEDRKFVISMIILIPLLFVVIFGNRIIPNDPLEMNTTMILQGSSLRFPLGTDEFGRCILSRLILGIRPSIFVALSATAIAFAAGSILGILSGYRGGVFGNATMRVVEIILSFPPILLAMLIVGLFGAGVRNLIVIIGILYTPHFARIAYSNTLKLRKMEYVESEISIGSSLPSILFKTIFPNILASLIIQVSLTISNSILLESGLSFLGLGVQPPDPSLGQMIGDAKTYISFNYMYLVWPSLFLLLMILAANLLGDSLRDILDPKLKSNI